MSTADLFEFGGSEFNYPRVSVPIWVFRAVLLEGFATASVDPFLTMDFKVKFSSNTQIFS
jgi:hypothetical protein